jgi:hypothetical protein
MGSDEDDGIDGIWIAFQRRFGSSIANCAKLFGVSGCWVEC